MTITRESLRTAVVLAKFFLLTVFISLVIRIGLSLVLPHHWAAFGQLVGTFAFGLCFIFSPLLSAPVPMLPIPIIKRSESGARQMRQALLILAKSMILGAGSSVLFVLGLHLVISEHWALDRIGRNHVDTWITVAIVWFFTLVTWFIVSRHYSEGKE